MKNKFTWIHCNDSISTTITEQMLHDFNLKRQETTHLKRKASYTKMLRKSNYFRIPI